MPTEKAKKIFIMQRMAKSKPLLTRFINKICRSYCTSSVSTKISI